jgi:hypothetical protein
LLYPNVISYSGEKIHLKLTNSFSRKSLSSHIYGFFLTNGIYRTFFGGNDESWAPKNDTYTYYRNIEIWGGSTPSTFAGDKVSSSSKTHAGLAGVLGALFISLSLSVLL